MCVYMYALGWPHRLNATSADSRSLILALLIAPTLCLYLERRTLNVIEKGMVRYSRHV